MGIQPGTEAWQEWGLPQTPELGAGGAAGTGSWLFFYLLG